ncbi:hypothetical protein JCM11251_004459 [Rhodosporidiobolus azoricus]
MEPDSAAFLEEPMKLRERRVREGFWVASSSDSDEDHDAGGSVSDGDPPYLAGREASTTHTSAVADAVPVSVAPSYAGSETGSVAASGAAPGGGGRKASTGGGRRTFEELEDIIFSNPRSFVTLAGTIADARGVHLVISDDRTHKVSSAYMHVSCSYKKAGCPLILKLTKAKEGGWIIKGAKAPDKHMDGKQRSCYRCRHPAGSRPDTSHGVSVSDWLSKSHSYPEPGTKPKAAKSRTASTADDSMYSPEGSFPAQMESLAGKAPTTRGLAVASRMIKAENGGGGAVTPSPVADADRALAPPFQRSIDLQAQISPALPVNGGSPGGRGGGLHGSPQELVQGGRPPYYHSTSGPTYRTDSPPVPRHRPSHANGNGGVPYGSPYDVSGPPYHGSYPPSAASTPRYPYTSTSVLPPHPSSFPPPPPQNTLPVVCTSSPSALPEWTLLLTTLGDPSLLPLAKVLASPAVSCTPTEYFAAGVDPKLQEAFLNELPEKAIGLWPKLKFGKAMREGGEEAWKKVLEQRERDGERGFVSGVRRNTLPKDIPMQGAVLGNGSGASHTPSPGLGTSAGAAMDVDPAPSGTASPAPRPLPAGEESSNPPPPPGAAAASPEEEGTPDA